MEADFACTGTAAVMKIVLTSRYPNPPIVLEGGFANWRDKQLDLPSWSSEDAYNFDKTGFTGGLN